MLVSAGTLTVSTVPNVTMVPPVPLSLTSTARRSSLDSLELTNSLHPSSTTPVMHPASLNVSALTLPTFFSSTGTRFAQQNYLFDSAVHCLTATPPYAASSPIGGYSFPSPPSGQRMIPLRSSDNSNNTSTTNHHSNIHIINNHNNSTFITNPTISNTFASDLIAVAPISCSQSALMAAVKSLNVAVSGLNSTGALASSSSPLSLSSSSSSTSLSPSIALQSTIINDSQKSNPTTSSTINVPTTSNSSAQNEANNNSTGVLISTGVTLNRKSKMMLKKTNNDRKYPCGFPGCEWVFTRTNHVLRHQQRVHPGWASAFPKFTRPRATNSTTSVTVSPIAAAYANQLLDKTKPTSVAKSKVSSDSSKSTTSQSNKLASQSSNNSISTTDVASNSKSAIKTTRNRADSSKSANSSAVPRFQCNVNACIQKFATESQFHSHLKSAHNLDRSSSKSNANKNATTITRTTINTNQKTQSTNNNNNNKSSGCISTPSVTVTATSSNSFNDLTNNKINNTTITSLNNLNNCQSSHSNNQTSNSISFGGSSQLSNNLKLLLSNKQLTKDAFGAYLNSLTSSLGLRLLPGSSATLDQGPTASASCTTNATSQATQQLQVPHIQSVVVQQPKFNNNNNNTISIENTAHVKEPKLRQPQTSATIVTNSFVSKPSIDFTSVVTNNHHHQHQHQQQQTTFHSNNNGALPVSAQILLSKLRSDSPILQSSSSSSMSMRTFQCPLDFCKISFDIKEQLDDHLFFEHRVLEPQLCITCDDGTDWLRLPDPQPMQEDDEEDCVTVGQQLPIDLNNNRLLFNQQQTTKLTRGPEDPTLADAFGVIKMATLPRVDNVNRLSNIAATTSNTYAGLTKKHYCDVGTCTKSFTKRYHLVRHKLEAHQIGRQSMKSKLPDNEQPVDFSSTGNASLNAINEATKAIANNPSPPKVQKMNASNLVKPLVGKLNSTKLGAKSAVGDISGLKLSTRLLNGFFSRPPPAQEYRPFKCRYPNCGWSFKRQYHLKRHVRTHKNYEEIVQQLLLQEHSLLLPFSNGSLQTLLNNIPALDDSDEANTKPIQATSGSKSKNLDSDSNDETNADDVNNNNTKSIVDERMAEVSFLEKVDLRPLKKIVNPNESCLKSKKVDKTESADDSGYPDDDCSVIEDKSESDKNSPNSSKTKQSPFKVQRSTVPIDNRIRSPRLTVNKNSTLFSLMQQKQESTAENTADKESLARQRRPSKSLLIRSSSPISNGHYEPQLAPPVLDRSVYCDYPNCGRTFSALKYYRQHYTVHEKHEQKLMKKLAEAGVQRTQLLQQDSSRVWLH